VNDLPSYAGRDARLAPVGIVELRLPHGVYLTDIGDEDAQRVFGWYYGYPACCVDWFAAWSAENRRRDIEHMNVWLATHPGWNDPIPPAPRDFPPQHPVSGHLLCPTCVAGPPAPLPYRPARHFGWAFAPEFDGGDPRFEEPCDYSSDAHRRDGDGKPPEQLVLPTLEHPGESTREAAPNSGIGPHQSPEAH
jgi:hypothetical protein